MDATLSNWDKETFWFWGNEIVKILLSFLGSVHIDWRAMAILIYVRPIMDQEPLSSHMIRHLGNFAWLGATLGYAQFR